MRRILLHEKMINENGLQNIQQKIDREIEDAVKFAKESPYPDKKQLFMNLYDEIYDERIMLDEQRTEVLPSH